MSAVAAAGIATHQRIGTWRRNVDRYIVLSAFARDRLVRAGLPEDRLLSGSNFVADPKPRRNPPSASSTVLFVGRISAEKGLSVLLHAWRAAAPAGLRLEVIGDGPERIRLEASTPPAVSFLGQLPRSEVIDRLSRARALVVPSIWYEGQPVTALEGLAAGTPLILSDIGGLPEIIAGLRGSGWTCRPRDAVALAAAIGALTDDAEVDARGAAARHRYLDAYTPQTALARLNEIYASTVDSARW
jgi:glycosyltransferase involved in cell wall biosynthesis